MKNFASIVFLFLTALSVLANTRQSVVKFQELAVGVNGQRTWKVMGPDLNGHYGGLNGVGGLEATIRESDGTVTPVLNDFFGNVLATISGTTASWTSVRVGGYGPVLGYQAATLNAGTPLAESLLWRSRRIDPSGFYNLGARYYDPMAGRFLSPDPMGHAGSMDLYSAFNGDPINHFDPDGRFSAGSLNGAEKYGSQTYASLGNLSDAVFGTVVGMFNPRYALNTFSGGHQADPIYQQNYDRGSDAYRAGSDFGYVAAGIGLQVGLIAATEGLAELAPALEGAEGLEGAGMGLGEGEALGAESGALRAEGEGLAEGGAANTFTASGQGEFGFASELESAPAQSVAQPFASQVASGASQAQQLELITLGPEGPGQFTFVPSTKPPITTIQIPSGFSLNRTFNSGYRLGSGSGPMGGSFALGNTLPSSASQGIVERGLNLPGIVNDSELGMVYQTTTSISATYYQTALGGTKPEVYISVPDREFLTPVTPEVRIPTFPLALPPPSGL